MATWQVVDVLFDDDDEPVWRSIVDEAETEAAAQAKADALNHVGQERNVNGEWHGYGVQLFPPEVA